MSEEQQYPWVKRLFSGFARTSDYNGPRKPENPHHLIQEIDSELPVSRPALQLTYRIFGSCPPMQSFDPAKMLTVRLHTLFCFLFYSVVTTFLFYKYFKMSLYWFLYRIRGNFRHSIYCWNAWGQKIIVFSCLHRWQRCWIFLRYTIIHLLDHLGCSSFKVSFKYIWFPV